MARHAVINKDGLVVNVIEWDGVAPWKPPVDHINHQSDEVDRDDTFDFKQKKIIKKDRTAKGSK